jgi:septum formation inhibitor MinC
MFSKDEIKINKDDLKKISTIAFNNVCKILETKNIEELEISNKKLSSDLYNLKQENSNFKHNFEKVSKELKIIKNFLEKKELLEELDSHKSELNWNIAKQYLGTKESYLNQILKKQEPNDFEKNLIQTVALKQKSLEK